MNKIEIINTFPYDTRWEDFINWVYDKKKSDLLYKTTFVGCIVSVFLNKNCRCGSRGHLSGNTQVLHEKKAEPMNSKQVTLNQTVLKFLSEKRDPKQSLFAPIAYNRTDFIKALKISIKELKEKGVL